MTDKERLQKNAGIEYPPTDLTYELRIALTGHRADEFNSWGYQWTDKPHRLVFAACCEAEALSARVEELDAALRGLVDFTNYAPEAQRVDVWHMRLAKARALLSQPTINLNIDAATFLAAVDREGDHAIGAGSTSQPAPEKGGE